MLKRAFLQSSSWETLTYQISIGSPYPPLLYIAIISNQFCDLIFNANLVTSIG